MLDITPSPFLPLDCQPVGASLSTVSATYIVLYAVKWAHVSNKICIHNSFVCVCGFAGVDVITPLKDINVLEGTKAVLECKVSVPDVTSVKWYLNDEQIKPDDRLHAVVKGTKQRLVINRTYASDEGPYKLMVGRVETSCDLSVESKNCSMSLSIILSILFSQYNSNQVIILFFPPEIKIIRGLHDLTCTETQNVVLEVELSHSGIDVLWNFKDKEIYPSSKYKIEAHGKIYKLTVLNMMKDDEGEYIFYAGENMTSGKLIVAG